MIAGLRRLRRRPRIAIYTAIFGGYDRLNEQPALPGVDFFCFTDEREARSERWRVEVREPPHEHPRLAAKWFKMNPHRLFADYRHTIWIDGNVKISTESFADEVLACVSESGLALFRHPDRDNVFDEARFSSEMPKYEGLPVLEQVDHYRAQGFDASGLYACGILVRDNASEKIRQLNDDWMHENTRWTYQDQLSLPFLLWKHGIEPGVIPYDLWDNPLFTLAGHATVY